MFPVVRLRLKKLLLWAAPLAGLACGGEGGTDVVVSSLRITTVTTGVELDPDGYGVSIGGQSPHPVGVQATLTIDQLSDGQYTVELSGIAPNCGVEGENPRPVSVITGATATVAFEVACGAATGVVQVSTSTAGAGTDPDGFALLLDGGDGGSIGLSGNTSLAGLEPGLHAVGLTGLAANCQVAGENPQPVTVVAGETAQVTFAVTCTPPGATIGSVEIIVSTSGFDRDPNGYRLSVDGGASQPIGINTLVRLENLAATNHTVQLLDVASNCTVGGTNPAQVSVPIGGTAEFGFVVVCTALALGSIEISVTTSGSTLDPDGYTVSIDAGTPLAITVNGSRTFTNLSPGTHSVRLAGAAANCQVTGSNPVGVPVAAGEIASVAFSVTCGATVGQLAVTISGLPSSAQAAVTVTGPNNFSQTLTSTRTLTGLTPGSYAIGAANIVFGATTYTPSASRPTIDVAAGGTAAVSVSYTAEASVTLNLRIDGLYLTQSTQTYGSDVPLIAGRDGFLRVFLIANQTNSARPAVRVRLSRPGASTQTFTIAAPGASTPTQVQEGTISSSWNVQIPGSQIQPGLSVVADVDPGGEIEESNEGDNQFPSSGAKSLIVRAVPAARIRFVSVQQGSQTPGNVSPGNLLELTRRLHPLGAVDVDVDPAVFTASVPLEANGNGWGQVLGDLDAKRVSEGSNRTYFGVAKLGYGRQNGLVGLAFQGVPTALGWDDASDAPRVVAHELGHTWNQLHTPCGNPPDIDASYPYGTGIGVYGFDVAAGNLKPPSTPDIMGYCTNPWISDYTYRRVMNFRGSSGLVSIAAMPQPSLLIWGRIENGRPVLEPAFHIVTRPSLPERRGPYSVTATASDGSHLLTISFDAATAADDPQGTRHFAFAVPLSQTGASRIASLRLGGPGGVVRLAPQQLAQVRGAESIVARRQGENVSLQWNPAAHPMIMVRDPDTGEVLSFARGGATLVRTTKGELDLLVSDGVGTQRVRLAISRS